MAPQALQDLEQPTKPSRPAQPPAIRPAQTADIPALTRLEATCFDSDRLSRRSFQHMITLAKAPLFVIDAEGGGDLLGYGLVLFHHGRSAERREGQECVSPCRTRWCLNHLHNIQVRQPTRSISRLPTRILRSLPYSH